MSSNTKTGSASKIKMESFDDLFGGSSAQEIGAEQIINAPLADLHEFKDHPFKGLDDEKMEETTESIRLYGVLVPGIARPRAGGGYELIAVHRRKHGSERVGKTEMPIIVRNYSDDEATIIMVDSNIQREDILPSEKAKAYKMKYEAMKHQGKKSGKNTLDEVGEAAGENAKKVQRYIWLSRLYDELLEMVDSRKLGFSQGVEISFLPEEAQQWVEVIIEEQGCNVSIVQSGKPEEELEKCRYNYKGKDTYAFVMSDRYIMALYTYCFSARKAVALENIELEGLSEAELSMVKLESVREVLFQALLLDDVKFEDGKMYAELYSIYIL